jgi:uncharacterized phage infection (PIP) family protein YhgE
MSESGQINPDALELLERRLTDAITKNVQSRLFKTYFAMGAVAVAVLGFVGWNVVDTATNLMSDRIERKYLTKMETKIEEASLRISTSDALLQRASAAYDKVDELAASANDSLQKISKLAEAAEPKFASVEKFTQQVQDLMAQTMDLESQLATSESAANQVDEIVRQLPGLATQVTALAELVANITPAGPIAADPTQPTARQVAESTASIGQTASQAIDTIDEVKGQTVVYLQYNGMPAETAQQIRERLQNQSFILPGKEEVPMPDSGLSEVRYYYEGDLPRAEAVAGAANEVIQSLGILALPVAAKSLVSWPRRKPKEGTVELWIGLPTTASAAAN